MKVDSGYLIIADITGYTAFLSKSELEHAHDILQSLIQTIIDQIQSPLVISRLQGDAVICYALDSSIKQGQTLLEQIEAIYYAFARMLATMEVNTTCSCTACELIPDLDLKFVVHHGSFSQQKLGDYIELLGNDVNVAHRLLKNDVPDATGVTAYVLFSEEALAAMGIDPAEESMIAHTESYEHVGEQQIYVHDMKPRWAEERDRSRVLVSVEDALTSVSSVLPTDVVTAWEFVTEPSYRNTLLMANRNDVVDKKRGRISVGSSYHCYHGEDNSMDAHFILDWRPFEYYTIRAPGMQPDTITTWSIFLTPVEGGTQFTMTVSPTEGKSRRNRKRSDKFLSEEWPAFMESAALPAFVEFVAQELAARGVEQRENAVISGEAITSAIMETIPTEGA